MRRRFAQHSIHTGKFHNCWYLCYYSAIRTVDSGPSSFCVGVRRYLFNSLYGERMSLQDLVSERQHDRLLRFFSK